MPALIFQLNNKPMSHLSCPGLGSFQAFSGSKPYVNDPVSVGIAGKGPIPRGTYYIADRQGGGSLGSIYDATKDVINHTHRNEWFALYRIDGKIDDSTWV